MGTMQPKLVIRDVEHYYQWITAAEQNQRTQNPVMIFIHGWGGSGRYWQSTALALSSSYDCLLYDLRGFGRSQTHAEAAVASPVAPVTVDPATSPDHPFALEAYAEDLAEMMQQLQIPRATIQAHSMGASIALYFANRYPMLLDRLILTCSGIFEYDEPSFSAFYKFGRYVVAFRPNWLKYIPLANRIFMARFLHRALPAADSQAFLEDFLIADGDAALGTIFASVSKRATEVMPEEFRQLAIATLLISGQYDQIIPADLGRTAASLSDQVEYVEIANTGHFPMLEAAEVYLQQVQSFLKE